MKLRRATVYLLTFEGLPYVGSTLNLKDRTDRWRWKLAPLGISFSIKSLLICAESERYFFEARAVRAYNSVAEGWNLALTGRGGGPGRVFSKESRTKMSKAHTGMKYSAEARENMGASKRGRPHSKAHCDAIRAALLRPSVRAKLSAATKGTTLTMAHRKKISNAVSAAWARKRSP